MFPYQFCPFYSAALETRIFVVDILLRFIFLLKSQSHFLFITFINMIDNIFVPKLLDIELVIFPMIFHILLFYKFVCGKLFLGNTEFR